MADGLPPAGERHLLQVDDLGLRFGGLEVLAGISMTVERGSVCGLVGPNGAGKTSLFNCVSGLYRPQRGTVTLDGTDLLAHHPHELAALGLARTFQHVSLLPEATVLDNVLVGGHARSRGGAFAHALRLPAARREEAGLRDRAMALLDSLGLAGVAGERAGSLPFGSQKRAEIARALLAEPRLLMLDEPAGGLAHEEVDAFAELLRRLRGDHDLTILLVEHHMGLVSAVTDKVVALIEGSKVAEGSAAEVRSHPAVVEAYLGTAA
jgi:branched-chain amino acid transport system ATP-binding protein